MSPHQWAMRTTWLWGIPNFRAYDLIAEFVTSNRRGCISQESKQEPSSCTFDGNTMSTCTTSRYENNSHVQGPVELKAWVSWLPPQQAHHGEKDWHIVSVAHEGIQSIHTAADHWIARDYNVSAFSPRCSHLPIIVSLGYLTGTSAAMQYLL